MITHEVVSLKNRMSKWLLSAVQRGPRIGIEGWKEKESGGSRMNGGTPAVRNLL